MTRLHPRWRDWSLGTKSAIAVAVPLALLLLGLLLVLRQQQRVHDADEDVRRALAIQAEVQTLNFHIANSAMSVRGYLLTGRDEFLTPYRRAKTAIPESFAALNAQVRDPAAKAQMARIKALWIEKRTSLELFIEHGRSEPAEDLQAHLVASKAILDQLRGEVDRLYVRETQLVARYSDIARDALRQVVRVGAITSLLVLGSGLAAFWLLFSGVVQRVQKLVINAERLSTDEPLIALPSGHDELGVLAQRLQNASALLARRAAEAQSANLAKTQFLSRTSHELRTPLNAILGFAQLMAPQLHTSEQQTQLTHILTAGRHLLALIDEVLDIARIEAGDMRLNIAPQALAPLLLEVRDLMAPRAAHEAVRIHLAACDDALWVQADAQRLRQVLINLLSNAVKYNRRGGQVWLSAARDGDTVRVTVEDNGLGIKADQIPRLFAPFERLDAAGKGVEGTGLGLAVSKQLMLAMGGEITVQSTAGNGSCFNLHLPAAAHTPVAHRSAPHRAAAPSTPATGASGDGIPLLVVEDQASNLALIQAMVARRPAWRLHQAQTGAEAIALARAIRPALVLLDLHLPDTAGEAVLAGLRQDPVLASTPVVIVSADAMPERIHALKALGAADYLTKPLDVPRFLAVLDDYLPT